MEANKLKMGFIIFKKETKSTKYIVIKPLIMEVGIYFMLMDIINLNTTLLIKPLINFPDILNLVEVMLI